MKNKDTLGIVLHYGSKAFTWECVNSIIDNNFIDILVVDNDPLQDLMVPDNFLSKVSLYKTGGLMGFAEANNAAVTSGIRSHHKYLLLLNNDTIVINDAISMLKNSLQQGDVGVAGPCIPYAGNPTEIWACGGVIHKIRLGIGAITVIKSKENYEVDYLPGAVLMCRLDIFNLVGGLPAKYFLAYEEAEFALEVKKRGYKTLVVPNAVVLHHVGLSSDVQPMYFYNSVRNRIRFGKYIFGHKIGFIWGVLVTLMSNKVPGYQISLWAKGVSDEVMGIPLNRLALQKIKNYTD